MTEQIWPATKCGDGVTTAAISNERILEMRDDLEVCREAMHEIASRLDEQTERAHAAYDRMMAPGSPK